MAHNMTTEADLSRLAKQWAHGEVIALLGYQPSWYLISSGKLLGVENAFTGQDRPRWLGTDITHPQTTGFVYLAARGPIFNLTAGERPVSNDTARMALRSDDLLIVEPTPDAPRINVPPLQNVRYAMVAQSWVSAFERSDRDQAFACIISEACWTSYRETVVQWRGKAEIGLDASESELGDLSHILAKKIGDDLSIFDDRNGRTLTLRKVFADDGADPSGPQPTIVLGRLQLWLGVANIRNALRDQPDLAVSLKDLASRNGSA